MLTRNHLIGVHGKAGAGKDTIADYLATKHGFVRRGFADPLYEEVSHAFRVPIDWLKDRSIKELPQAELRLSRCYDGEFQALMVSKGQSASSDQSPRQILQWWGTEYRRAQREDYWILQMAEFCRYTLAKLPDGSYGVPERVAIPDCRFENEARWICGQGGQVVEVVRPGAPGVAAHKSEDRLPADLITTTLNNDGGLDDLYALVDNLFATA